MLAQSYNVLDFGAKPDGKTMNTVAIQKTIDKCGETGGQVYFPQGTFLSGSIFLKSNVTLYLSANSVLKGSSSPDDYADIFENLSKGEKTKIVNLDTQRRCRIGFVVAQNVHHVGIEGTGTIDGNSGLWTGSKQNDGPNRPSAVMFIYCEDVKMKDFTLRNSVNWGHYYLKCNRVQVDGVKLKSLNLINNDGLDIESSNVTVSNCIIDTDDDGIVMKSSDYEPIENITITNCQIGTNCNGIKFGTSSLGGFKNIAISNCTIHKASETTHWFWQNVVKDVELPLTAISGLALEVVDGGIMENINIDNITMYDVQTPIFIFLGNRGRLEKPGDPPRSPGKIRNVVISNILAKSHSKMSSSITGQEGFLIENLQLNNILIDGMGMGTEDEANLPVPEKPKSYPENRMYGYSLPAHGFYVRHAKNISFRNVDFLLRNPDARPAYAFENVENISVVNNDNTYLHLEKQIEKTVYKP